MCIRDSECGVRYNSNNNVKNILKKQNSFGWIGAYFNKSKNVVNDLAEVDETVLRAKVASLRHLQEEVQVAPVDAKVEYLNNEFTITNEVNGSTIDQEKLISEIKLAFSEGKESLNLTEKKCYVEPAVKANDAKLQNLLDAARKYASAAITYKTRSGDVVLDGSTSVSYTHLDVYKRQDVYLSI